MIFSGNTTALGASTIPMAEGYDCSYGVGLALVESARNDLAVFKAMVQADYKEMAIMKESTGVIQEGELAAFHEAVGGGIFKKIADLFRKLIAKIKSIFHNFAAKFNALFMKDKDLIKKYERELGAKGNLGKLEVKWRKRTSNTGDILERVNKDFSENADGWNSEEFERVKHYLGGNTSADSVTEYISETIDAALEDQETVTLSEIGGWRQVVREMLESGDWLKKLDSTTKKLNTKLESIVKKYDKAASDASKASHGKEDGSDEVKKSNEANHEYDMAQAYQTAILANFKVTQDVITISYKQAKAAFMKAVAANDKKLAESTYLDAVAETAEEEVEGVINKVLSDEELSDFSAASKNVKDADVSDDPNKLTYGPDLYNDDPSVWKGKDGEIDSCIGGGKVEVKESAYFEEMFY